MPMVLESSRERCLAPIPAPPPTRMCCNSPSLIIASGSPFSEENTMINPQKVPGCMQYFSSVRIVLSDCGQVITSDFMRIAKMPSYQPSMVPQR